MAESKPRRAYRSRLREDRAAQTRAAVIRAARKLFVEQGWHSTTIAAVAVGAGVSAESVYAIFGSKPQLLLAVVQATVRRTEPETPLVKQGRVQAVADAPDQETALNLFATSIAGVLESVAPLVAVISVAAKTDPDVAVVYDTIHRGRRENLALAARALAQKGSLRRGVTEGEVLEQLWRLASPELFLLLTRTEGMSAGDYAVWLERTVRQLVLIGE